MKATEAGTEQLAALGMTLVLASLTVGFLTIGCGSQESKSASTETGAVQTTDRGNGPVAANASAEGTGLAEATASAEGGTTAQGDSLPPDILASASEEFVLPGDVVEIKAQGTVDVVDVTLKDGRGITTPLTYDAAASLWRGHYRVPLKATTDRVGLSVTAKNGLNQWRRVWVFLNVQREVAEIDSAATP